MKKFPIKKQIALLTVFAFVALVVPFTSAMAAETAATPSAFPMTVYATLEGQLTQPQEECRGLVCNYKLPEVQLVAKVVNLSPQKIYMPPELIVFSHCITTSNDGVVTENCINIDHNSGTHVVARDSVTGRVVAAPFSTTFVAVSKAAQENADITCSRSSDPNSCWSETVYKVNIAISAKAGSLPCMPTDEPNVCEMPGLSASISEAELKVDKVNIAEQLASFKDDLLFGKFGLGLTRPDPYGAPVFGPRTVVDAINTATSDVSANVENSRVSIFNHLDELFQDQYQFMQWIYKMVLNIYNMVRPKQVQPAVAVKA